MSNPAHLSKIPGYLSKQKKTWSFRTLSSKVPGGALMFRDNDICFGPAISWARDKPQGARQGYMSGIKSYPVILDIWWYMSGWVHKPLHPWSLTCSPQESHGGWNMILSCWVSAICHTLGKWTANEPKVMKVWWTSQVPCVIFLSRAWG